MASRRPKDRLVIPSMLHWEAHAVCLQRRGDNNAAAPFRRHGSQTTTAEYVSVGSNGPTKCHVMTLGNVDLEVREQCLLNQLAQIGLKDVLVVGTRMACHT